MKCVLPPALLSPGSSCKKLFLVFGIMLELPFSFFNEVESTDVFHIDAYSYRYRKKSSQIEWVHLCRKAASFMKPCSPQPKVTSLLISLSDLFHCCLNCVLLSIYIIWLRQSNVLYMCCRFFFSQLFNVFILLIIGWSRRKWISNTIRLPPLQLAVLWNGTCSHNYKEHHEQESILDST